MQKSVISTVNDVGTRIQGEWLDLDKLARVEVTSEDAGFPIESVFSAATESSWRAAATGRQIVRLIFSAPRPIHRIHLEFAETEVARLQEFTLRWAAAQDGTLKDIVRQQWNFSPQGSVSEIENYDLDLPGVSVLELDLNPDLSGGLAVASLVRWRVA